MSGNKLIDDYLSDLMEDLPDAPASAADRSPDAPLPASSADGMPHGAANAPSAIDAATGSAETIEDMDAGPAQAAIEPTGSDPAGHGEAVAHAPAVADGEPQHLPDEPSIIDGADQADVMAAQEPDSAAAPATEADFSLATTVDDGLAAVAADSSPAPTPPEATGSGTADGGDADLLAGFRHGGSNISDDEFEAMLDVLQGRAAPPAVAAVTAEPAPSDAGTPPGDPLAAFRDGGAEISEDEFEAMLDALAGQPPTPPTATRDPVPATAVAPPAASPAPPSPSPPVASAPAGFHASLGDLVGDPATPAAPSMSPEPPPERRQRRAEERVTSWLRFTIARQSFAVEVLKVQEVLKLPSIMPVRGTERAMLGAMNLRGQIVPVMDLAVKLGFPEVERTEATRVIVLEEHGETLGMLVASVADVTNVSDARIERISGTPSLVAADIVRGIARREGAIIILLDASRLLA